MSERDPIHDSEQHLEEQTDEKQADIQKVFGLVDREVWIVTAACDAAMPVPRGGLVATWVSQASLHPEVPTVLIAIAKNHYTAQLIDGSNSFAVHLLSAAQIDLVWRFGMGTGRDRDKIAGLEAVEGATGAPILADCLAWLDCRVITRHDAGDRWFYWGDVVNGAVCGEGKPLCEQELLAAASSEQKSRLRANLLADLQIQRPLFDAWRKNRPQT